MQTEDLIAIFGDKPGEWNFDYHEFALAIGMKGGKNFLAETIVSYACYFIKSLVNPHDYFTKITKRPIKYTQEKNFDIVNVSSVDETQARRVFFDTVKNVLRLTKCPKTGENWYEKYAGLDMRPGGFGDMQSKIIMFPTAVPGAGTIRLMSFNSTASAPEGIHCLLYMCDELSRADTKPKYNEAKKLLDLGINNTTASFPNRTGKVIEWAYLNDTDFDLTNERYELSFTIPTIYGRKCATWDYNPAVSKETFGDIYKADPIKAKTVFEGIKPTSKDNFFQPYVDKIPEVISQSIFNTIRTNRIITHRQTNGKEYSFTGTEVLRLEGDNRVRCFSADPSKVRDRFCIVGGYLETIDPMKMEIFIGETPEVINTNSKPIIDTLIVIDPIPGSPIDYMDVANIFSLLIQKFPNTKSINFDHFQNEKLRQEIINRGIESETYFFSNQAQLRLYTILRANIWNNNFVICQDEHKLTVNRKELSFTDLYEFEAKHLIKDGLKLDHPSWGSKDLIDSIAICNYDLMNLEVSGVATEITLLTEEKLRKLCEIYMEEKYKLIEAETPLESIESILADKLNLKPREADILRDFVKENYNY